MNIPKTITGEVGAFLYSVCNGPEDLAGEHALQALFFSHSNHTGADWVKVGTAQVTVTLLDHDKMMAGQIEALRKEQTKVQADAQAEVTKLERQIQQLLAITNEVTA